MMKRHVAAVLLTVTVAVPFLVAATNDKTTDSGTSAVLGFTVIEPLTCADGSPGQQFRNVLVVGRHNITRIDGTPVAFQQVELYINSTETCTGHVQGLSGIDPGPSSYTQFKASSATVAASIALTDTLTGAPAGNAAVNLSFASSETPIKSWTTNRFMAPGEMVTIRNRGSLADATASGSLVVDGGNLMPLAQDSFATLGTGTTGVRILLKK